MPKKLHIRKGDMVYVNSGDYKGTKGKVLAVFPKKQKALVEGVNIISKHTKPTQENPEGGVMKMEAPVHISNLMVADPANDEPTRIGRKENQDGKLVRFAVKSMEEIK